MYSNTAGKLKIKNSILPYSSFVHKFLTQISISTISILFLTKQNRTVLKNQQYVYTERKKSKSKKESKQERKM